MAEAIQWVKNRAVGGADDLVAASIVIDSHSLMCAGSFTGNELAVGEVDEEAALPISWIRKSFGAIGCLVRIANHCACM